MVGSKDDRDLNVKIGADLTRFKRDVTKGIQQMSGTQKGFQMDVSFNTNSTKKLASQLRTISKSVEALRGSNKIEIELSLKGNVEQIKRDLREIDRLSKRVRTGQAGGTVVNVSQSTTSRPQQPAYRLKQETANLAMSILSGVNHVPVGSPRGGSLPNDLLRNLYGAKNMLALPAIGGTSGSMRGDWIQKVFGQDMIARDGGLANRLGRIRSMGDRLTDAFSNLDQIFGETGIVAQWSDQTARDPVIRGLYRLRGLLGDVMGVGFGVSATAGVAGFGGLGMSAKVGMDFEQAQKILEVNLADQLGRNAVGTDQLAESMAKLSEKSIELSRTGIYDATKITAGMTELVRMGNDANTVLAQIGPTMKLAEIESLDMGQAAYYVSTTMLQFKLQAEQAAHVAGVMAKASADSALTVEMLGHDLEYAGSSARTVGWSLESTVASMETMAQMGIPMYRIGFYIRGLSDTLMDLYSNQKKVGLLRGIGVRVFDSQTGKIKDFAGILEQFESARKRLNIDSNPRGYARWLTVMGTVFPREQVMAIMGALDNTMTVTEQMIDKNSKLLTIYNEQGVAVRQYQAGMKMTAADTQRYFTMQNKAAGEDTLNKLGVEAWNTTRGDLTKMVNELKNLGKTIYGAGLGQALDKLINKIADLAKMLDNLIDKYPKVGKAATVGLLGAGLAGPVIIAIGAMGKLIELVVRGKRHMSTLKTVMQGITWGKTPAKTMTGYGKVMGVADMGRSLEISRAVSSSLKIEGITGVASSATKLTASLRSLSGIFSLLGKLALPLTIVILLIKALFNDRFMGALGDFFGMFAGYAEILFTVLSKIAAPILKVVEVFSALFDIIDQIIISMAGGLLDLITGFFTGIEIWLRKLLGLDTEAAEKRLTRIQKRNAPVSSGYDVAGTTVNINGGNFTGSYYPVPKRPVNAESNSTLPTKSTPNGAYIPAFASGGVVTKPTFAMIGEAGPEAVVPLKSGNGLFGGLSRLLSDLKVNLNFSDIGKTFSKAIGKQFSEVGNQITRSFKNIFAKLFPGLFGKDFAGFFGTLWEEITKQLGNLWEFMIGGGGFNKAIHMVEYLWNYLTTPGQNGEPSMFTTFIDKVWKGIKQSFPEGLDIFGLFKLPSLDEILDSILGTNAEGKRNGIDFAALLDGSSFNILDIITKLTFGDLFNTENPLNAIISGLLSILPFGDLFNKESPLMPMVAGLITLIGFSDIFDPAKVLGLSNLFGTQKFNLADMFGSTVVDFSLKLLGIDTSSIGGGGSGDSNWLRSAGNSILGTLFNGWTPLATGGIVTGPTHALIGEAGPEAVIPLRDYAGLGGNVKVENHNHIYVNGEELADILGQSIVDKVVIKTGVRR